MSGLYYNFFQRNRSELLADYLLSSIGIATPVRRQFDHGIDFYCNLIKDNDSGFLTFGYPFAIQIKSASTSEIIYGKNKKKWRPENISWLFQNELPFFIGVVDKKYSSIEIYDTTGIWQLYLKDEKNFSQVILKPGKRGKHEWRGNVDKIELPNWDTTKGDSHKHIIDLGNPIINITLEDLNEKQVLQNKKGILSRVIKIEQENIIRRNLGIKCFKEIKSNAKNESHCEWGMNFRDFDEQYIPKIYDSLRLALISLSINLQVHERNEESTSVKNLLKYITKENYYKKLYEDNPMYFDWIKEIL